jgi:hypothetical protein
MQWLTGGRAGACLTDCCKKVSANEPHERVARESELSDVP